MENEIHFWFLKFAELEQAAALKYLYSWLRHHPKYGAIASPDQPENLYYADVRAYIHMLSLFCFKC